jgi:hypothetical protein
VGRRRILADFVRVELGVAIWRLADAICARGRGRLHGSYWQELGCRVGSVGELVIGGRLMDAADRLRWADDYSSDYERHPW